MSEWLILAAYVVGWLLVGYRLTLQQQEREQREWIAACGNEEEGLKAARGYLGFSLFFAYLEALVWPASIVVRVGYGALSGRGVFTTQLEKDIERKRELKELRELARRMNLPMGDEK